MNRLLNKRRVSALTALVAATLLAGCAGLQAPKTTVDGLELQDSSKFRQVYLKPGATLTGYSAYGVADCQVAFRKDWMRDQNAQRLDLGNRVTQQDVDRIKNTLAKECDKYFRASLTESPAYNLVEEFSEGEAVLLLRPTIINLDVNAPDLQSPGMERSYTTSAGEMTLQLELIDATTSEVLVRVIDRQRGMDTGRVQWSNSTSNKFEADRVLKSWAKRLREGLDKATAT